MSTDAALKRSPFTWVPSLYFAQGLPFFAVNVVMALMYKSMEVPNEQIARWSGLLSLAWGIKWLWSPFLELAPSKKAVVVVFQLLGGGGLCLVALSLQLPNAFLVGIAALTLVSLASATHDIASDGLYLVILAGHLEKSIGVANAWGVVFGLFGATMILLGLYHTWALPGALNVVKTDRSMSGVARTLWDVLAAFLKKPGIWLAIF